MSVDAAPYTVRAPLSIELRRAVPATITAPLYRDGSLVTATSCTATLYDASGVAVSVTGAAAVVAGVASWTLTPASSATLGAGYRVEWSITHAGGTVTHVVAAAMVRGLPLQPVITDLDLYRRQPMLDPGAVGSRAPEDLTTWQDYLDEAWTEILYRIWGQGQRPSLVMSPESLRAPHLYLTLALIYEGPLASDAPASVDYRAQYEHAWSSLRWVYDADDDGIPDDSGRRSAGQPTIWLC